MRAFDGPLLALLDCGAGTRAVAAICLDRRAAEWPTVSRLLPGNEQPNSKLEDLPGVLLQTIYRR